MRSRTLLSWSSGKDSAWALHRLQQDDNYLVVGLFTTLNTQFQRVAMHAVRLELLQAQAAAVGLPLQVIEIPHPCSNNQYESIMAGFIHQCRLQDIDCMAFGDLFLQDVRNYREQKLKGSGIDAVFPLWGCATDGLSQQMVDAGLQARITCIDPRQLPVELAGQPYDQDFLDGLPIAVDPCGERGEFHTFVTDGPMFHEPITVQTGEIVQREGFVFADLLPAR